MLRGIIICPDLELRGRLEDLLHQIGLTTITKTCDSYPRQLQLVRMVRALMPDVIFVSTDSPSHAFEIAREIGKIGSGTQIVGLSRFCDPQLLMEAMRVGIQEFAALPFDRVRLAEGLRRIDDLARERRNTMGPTGSIFSFLPAKAGVGSSTIALNTAMALSRSVESKILFSDLDVNGGLTRFVLQLQNAYGLNDVAERPMELVAGLWPYMVSAVGSLDVLHAGKLTSEFDLEGGHARQFVQFLRQRYSTLFFDMSGYFESYSLEIIHESKRIFLISTPEPAAVYLAREKYNYLSELDLAERVVVVINRWPKKTEMSLEQIEAELGLPVFAKLSNDYDGVQKAIGQGSTIEPSSGLGKEFTVLAQSILNNEANGWRISGPPSSRKKSFSGVWSAARLLFSEE